MANSRGRPKDPKTEVVLDYLRRFPNAATRTLTSKLLKEQPGLFQSFEDIRATINYYRGKRGPKNRKKIASKEFFQITDHLNPFDLPEEEEIPATEDYKFPYRKYNNLLVLSDLQIEYHDIQAITMAMEYGKKHGINGIILLGDVIDCFSLSVYSKDPRKRDFKTEKDKTVQFLNALRSAFPGVGIFWKLGNHEHRYQRYMEIKSPEFFDMDEFKWDRLFNLKELDIELIDWMRVIRCGKLNMVHGQEFGRGVYSPVNPARGAFIKGYASCMVAHWHQSSEHTNINMNGDIVTTWSLGCLCKLNPEYRPINNWNQGFAHIEMEPNGNYHVNNKRIYQDIKTKKYELL